MQNTPEYTKMMIALIQADYDIARADGEGITTYDRLKSLEPANGVALCLLGANADISDEINAIGEDGMNDVHRAIKAGQEQTLSILLASGGDSNIPMSDGTLPIILAMQSKLNMSEMFYVLVKNGANVSGFDIEAIKGLESLGTVIDPKTTKYIAAARDGSLSDPAMDVNMKIADKSFWQKITSMSLDQISLIIGRFMSGDFDISDQDSVSDVLVDPSSVDLPGEGNVDCLGAAGAGDPSHDHSDVQ